MSDYEIIPVVDETDTIIGYKRRKDIELFDIYRVASLVLKDGKGRILLAQRGLKKKKNPGVWTVSVAGTVEKGETYRANIEKETFEEIGVNNIVMKEVLKFRSVGKSNFFVVFYEGVLDKKEEDFVLEENEVEQVRRFSREEFEVFKNDTNNVFGKNFLHALELYNFFK